MGNNESAPQNTKNQVELRSTKLEELGKKNEELKKKVEEIEEKILNWRKNWRRKKGTVRRKLSILMNIMCNIKVY